MLINLHLICSLIRIFNCAYDLVHVSYHDTFHLQAPPEPSYAAAERASKMRDYEVLCQIISQWNANRLDLFALTLANEVGRNSLLFIPTFWLGGAVGINI